MIARRATSTPAVAAVRAVGSTVHKKSVYNITSEAQEKVIWLMLSVKPGNSYLSFPDNGEVEWSFTARLNLLKASNGRKGRTINFDNMISLRGVFTSRARESDKLPGFMTMTVIFFNCASLSRRRLRA